MAILLGYIRRIRITEGEFGVRHLVVERTVVVPFCTTGIIRTDVEVTGIFLFLSERDRGTSGRLRNDEVVHTLLRDAGEANRSACDIRPCYLAGIVINRRYFLEFRRRR